MPSDLQVRIKNTAGVTQALLHNWRSLNFTQHVNDVGNYTLILDCGDPAIQYFEKDAIIEVWRRTSSLDWYIEFVGLHRTHQHERTETGLCTFTSYGRDSIDLLRRREIVAKAGSPEAQKSGAGDTVMVQYVQDHCLSRSPVIPNFSVLAAIGNAPTWTGARAWRNLLEVLQDISRSVSTDFTVDYLNPGFRFRTKYPQLGTSRIKGQFIVPPVVFSAELGNMATYSHTHSGTEEVTAVVVLGQGAEDSRVTTTVVSAHATDSIYNYIEQTFDANEEATIAGLQAVGNMKLIELQAKESVKFSVLQTPACQYRVDYFLGDRVTVQCEGESFDQKLVAVNILVNEHGEQLDLEFADF